MVTNDDSWLWALIPGVFDTVAAPGYAAYIDIDRNLNDNPIPKSCGNKENGRSDEHKSRKQVTDNVIGIYPSVDGIEKFLVHFGGNAGGGSGTGGTISIPKTESCPTNFHSTGQVQNNPQQSEMYA